MKITRRIVVCATCKSLQVIQIGKEEEKRCTICGRKVVAWKKDKKGTK